MGAGSKDLARSVMNAGRRAAVRRRGAGPPRGWPIVEAEVDAPGAAAGRAGELHQQVLARVVAAEDDVVDLADVGEAAAARVRDGALHVLLHLAQRLGERTLDRLEDALALDVLVLALVEVRGGAVVLLEELAVDLDGAAGRFLV